MSTAHPGLSRAKIARRAGVYQLTALWVAMATLAALVESRWLTLYQGIVISVLALLALVVRAMLRELRAVHVLVNGQRTSLLERIDQLEEIVRDAGRQVPAPSDGELRARRDAKMVADRIKKSPGSEPL